MKKILFLVMVLTSVAMAKQAQQPKQGMAGRVYLIRGNAMPSPGRKNNTGKPVSRSIMVYALTRRDEATANGSFFSQLKSHLIAKAMSNTGGYYAIALPVGKYSVFVEDSRGLYANSFDDKGNINPVIVKKDSISIKNITISYQAVY